MPHCTSDFAGQTWHHAVLQDVATCPGLRWSASAHVPGMNTSAAAQHLGEHLDHLAAGFSLLHLASSAPERVASWDAIVLTAASPQQAELYRLQLQLARQRGRIAARTLTLVAPDPDGKRIGSGGATLSALRLLETTHPGRDWPRRRVLLIHAGGDSRRVPWANVIGKLFIPLPLLADAEQMPTLFDHLLALAAHAALALTHGGLLTLTGDVLPLFNVARLYADGAASDGGVVVTAPVPLNIAGRHGVIIADGAGGVRDLLQKPSPAEVIAAGALVGGAALLDTGVYAFHGAAFAGLMALATDAIDPMAELLRDGRECSLYEEIAAALVPARHVWLATRPLGARLIAAIGACRLREHRDPGFRFVHLGTTGEVLDHLSATWQGRMERRILAECGAAVDESAVIGASQLAPGTGVGRGSLVVASRLGDAVRIGSRCVVLGLEAEDEPLRLPDHCCLWQIPLAGGQVATVCCGVDDNPKDELKTATFLNRSFTSWLSSHGVSADEVWAAGESRTLWTARLFPAQARPANLGLVAWMLAPGAGPFAPEARENQAQNLHMWRSAERHSFASLHRVMDPAAVLARQETVTARLVLRQVLRSLDGALDRNLAALAEQLALPGERARLAALGDAVPEPQAGSSGAVAVPASRLHQIRADLYAAGSERGSALAVAAEHHAARAFNAVQDEVARAIAAPLALAGTVSGVRAGERARSELPVRFDLAGGWSDTPPYCLEHPARVVNFAMRLDGELPIGAEVEALDAPRWELFLDGRGSTVITDTAFLGRPADLADPYILLTTALAISGYGDANGITQGVRLRTWSRVPKGSGLGASSILGAAVLAALQRLAGRAADPHTVSDLVLVLEQRMTTGGGWQDQIGGLFPGVKLIESAPVRPLKLRIEPVPLMPAVQAEFESRLVVVFTGQERLAKNVLQLVVKRYLQRDRRILQSIRELVVLADDVQRALALGDLDGVGAILGEVWQAHQQLDPHCSNPTVDAMLRAVADLAVGAKLAGAGGGGFMGVLAKDAAAAARIAQVLPASFPGARVYPWSLWLG